MNANQLKLAFYGDDFTGASDTLATLSAAGLKTLLFMAPPSAEQLAAAGPLDCLGIAGAARSMGNAEQHAELEGVGRFFSAFGVPVVHYKTCSTFDSAPQVGSIGLAVRTLRQQLRPNTFTAIVGGQPNLGRYCVFGNLFAAFNAGGHVYRLDRHPTMSRHPVTPMHEADLRLHLAQQGLSDLGLVQYPNYDLPAAQFDSLLATEVADHSDGVVFDIGHVEHLGRVGEVIWTAACRQPVLAVGPSSVAQALIAHWGTKAGAEINRTAATDNPAMAAPCESTEAAPVFVFSGSRSPVTASQLNMAASYLHVPLAPSVLMDAADGAYVTALDQVTDTLERGAHVLAYVTDEPVPEGVCAVALAKACALFVARVLSKAKPRRVGVAGGDTSSYTIKALDVWGLSYLGKLDSGVALCRLHSDDSSLDGVEVMLKGGQMGSVDIFEKLIPRNRGHCPS